MAKLTDEQAKALADLEALRDAPDDNGSKGDSKVYNFHVDLSDSNAVKLARKLGLMPPDDEGGEGEGGEGEGGEGEGEEGGEGEGAPAPRRRGYFK